MKALSLWQPWATLIALGVKDYETRTWATRHSGPLLIHAAKRPLGRDERRMLGYKVFAKHIPDPEALPFGAALCVVDLGECIPTEFIGLADDDEDWAFGDFADGRFAWELKNVRRFAKPIPMRGAQGLFEAPLSLEEALDLGGAA